MTLNFIVSSGNLVHLARSCFILAFIWFVFIPLDQEDYTTTNAPLTFSAGSSTSAQYTVAIVNDAIYEDNETFFILINSEGSGGSIPSATVVIIDDDSEL